MAVIYNTSATVHKSRGIVKPVKRTIGNREALPSLSLGKEAEFMPVLGESTKDLSLSRP